MPRHVVNRHIKFEREQLFDLVADVERYPEFVPWWLKATVIKTEGDTYFTRQVVGMTLVSYEFQSQTTLYRHQRIDVSSTDRPFRSMNMRWSFAATPDGGCDVRLDVEYELRSAGYGTLARIISSDGVRRLIDAFEGRAYHLRRHAATHPVLAATGLET